MAQFFPNIPVSQGTSGSTSARVLSANFGDGYSQEAADGINNIKEEWSVQWNRISTTDASTIDTFLKARGGWDAFFWTPPNQVSSKLWKCKSWNVVPEQGNYISITATFVEVFG